MRLRHAAMCTCAGGIAAAVIAVTVDAQRGPSPGVPPSEANHFIETPAGWVHPTTPWGDPDVQGMYNFSYVGSVRLQRCNGSNTGRAPDDIAPAPGSGRGAPGSGVFRGGGGATGGGRDGAAPAPGGGRGGGGRGSGGPCDPNVAFRSEEQYQAALERAAGAQDAHQRALETGDVGGALQAGTVDPTTPQRQTSLIMDPPNGQLPALTPEGNRRMREMRSSWAWYSGEPLVWDAPQDFDSWDRCITRGMPASMFPYRYNNGMQIIQAPGYVVLNLEMIHEARVVPVDGRKPLASNITQWMGESRGRWEGNTLVIETTNIKVGAPMTNFGVDGAPAGNRIPTSDQLRITERITRLNDDHILYEITTEDPVVLTRPWTARFPLKNDPGYEWWEYACHEGNTAIPNYINSSRAERAERGQQQPDAPQAAPAAGGRGRGAAK